MKGVREGGMEAGTPDARRGDAGAETRSGAAIPRFTRNDSRAAGRVMEDGRLRGDTVLPAYDLTTWGYRWRRQPAGSFYVEDATFRRVLFVAPSGVCGKWAVFFRTVGEERRHRVMELPAQATASAALRQLWRWVEPKQGPQVRIVEGDLGLEVERSEGGREGTANCRVQTADRKVGSDGAEVLPWVPNMNRLAARALRDSKLNAYQRANYGGQFLRAYRRAYTTGKTPKLVWPFRACNWAELAGASAGRTTRKLTLQGRAEGRL
jgi:hypothetical protein